MVPAAVRHHHPAATGDPEHRCDAAHRRLLPERHKRGPRRRDRSDHPVVPEELAYPVHGRVPESDRHPDDPRGRPGPQRSGLPRQRHEPDCRPRCRQSVAAPVPGGSGQSRCERPSRLRDVLLGNGLARPDNRSGGSSRQRAHLEHRSGGLAAPEFRRAGARHARQAQCDHSVGHPEPARLGCAVVASGNPECLPSGQFRRRRPVARRRQRPRAIRERGVGSPAAARHGADPAEHHQPGRLARGSRLLDQFDLGGEQQHLRGKLPARLGR